MITKTDLQAIREELESVVEANNKVLSTIFITKEDLEANSRILGTIIKVELAETNKRIDNLAKEPKELKKGQERLNEKAAERFKQLEDRIQALEEQLRNVQLIRS